MRLRQPRPTLGRRTRWALLVCALLGTVMLVRCMTADPLLDGLQYELNNRAFARESMAQQAAEPASADVMAFRRAYLELELLSHRRYQPIAHKYELEVSGWVVALKTRTSKVAFGMFPEHMLSFLTDATMDYVADLKALRDLAPAEDRAFFDYVVAQEQAQAEALQHVRDGRLAAGTKVLETFVASHRDLSAVERAR